MVEIFACRDVVVPEFGSRLNNADRDARTLSIFASSQGVDNACKHSSSLDVFMAVLVSALEDIKKKSSYERLPPILHYTFVACARHATNTVQSTGTNNSAPVDSPFQHLPSRPMQPYEKYNPNSSAPRAKLSTSARTILEDWFNEHYSNPYPTETEKAELAQRCQIALNQVNNFFGNKRMRIKRKVMTLPPAQDGPGRLRNEPAFDASAVLAPRTKWRAIVLSKIPCMSGGAMPGSTAATAAATPGTGTVCSVAGPGPGATPGLGTATTSHGHDAMEDGLLRESAWRGTYEQSAEITTAPQGQVVKEPQDIPEQQHRIDYSGLHFQ